MSKVIEQYLTTPEKHKWSARDRVFCEEYLLDLKAVDAAKRAGYAQKTADQAKVHWIPEKRSDSAKPWIWDYVKKLKAERAKETKIDAEFVLKRLAALVDFNIDDFIVRPENSEPFYDLSKATREQMWCIDALQIDQGKLYPGGGDDNPDVYKMKIVGPKKIEVLKTLGNHVDVQAFKENVGLSVEVSIAERILNSRTRKKK